MKAADLLRAQQVLNNERRIDLQSRRRQMETYIKAVVAATQKASESFDGCPSPVNIDWDSAAAIPNIRKSMPSSAVLRRGTIDYSLSDSLDAAKDLEIHANFLLDEALTNCNTGAHNVPLSSPPTSLDQYNSFPSVSSNPMPVVREKSVGKSVRISSDDDDGPSRKVQRKDSRDGKEQQTFFSAKTVFEDEGGVFKEEQRANKASGGNSLTSTISNSKKQTDNGNLPPELASCDKLLVDKIESEIIHHGQQVRFDDISGLEFAKQCVIESVCWPICSPHLFQGLRAIPRGILLFGPPGTGKTLIGKAIAHQSGATFFSISASSLMSKWIGEGEKTVRTLFAVAAYRQPSVVFIDEIDSLLCQRSSDENEATRRMKTEFLVQLDGAHTDLGARVVIVGATNRPEELDEAVRRRFVKRLYIPLPDEESRKQLLNTLLQKVAHKLSDSDIAEVVIQTKGYSGADIHSLCAEAAMCPLRSLARQVGGRLDQIKAEDVSPVGLKDFHASIQNVQPSVSPSDLKRYIEWNNIYGSYRLPE